MNSPAMIYLSDSCFLPRDSLEGKMYFPIKTFWEQTAFREISSEPPKNHYPLRIVLYKECHQTGSHQLYQQTYVSLRLLI